MIRLDRLALPLLIVSTLGACAVPAEDAAETAETPETVAAPLSTGDISLHPPTGMILSTANLYFTSNEQGNATVFRTGQGAQPGQERVLAFEAGATFGDIVFAQVGVEFFGYFFAQNAQGITLRRVSLAGGPMLVLNTTPIVDVDVLNSHHNLATDGVNVYWQEATSIKKMPIGGGPSVPLDTTTANTPTAGIFLRNDTIVFAANRDIRFVPTEGTTLPPLARTLATASLRVTTLRPVSNGVYWGDVNGAVQVKTETGALSTIQGSGLVPKAISTNASAAFGPLTWADCGGDACRLHFFFNGNHWFDAIGGDAVGLQLGNGIVFWGDSKGIHRKVVP